MNGQKRERQRGNERRKAGIILASELKLKIKVKGQPLINNTTGCGAREYVRHWAKQRERERVSRSSITPQFKSSGDGFMST